MQHIRWNEVTAEQLNPQLARAFVSTAQCTVARFELKKGCMVPRHSHANEQVAMLLSGRMKFIFDDTEVVLVPGETLIIAPNEPHAAEALEDSIDIDFFSPARSDWEKKKDAYLR
jgi:quercetin dioxygenase-like cupin family protein